MKIVERGIISAFFYILEAYLEFNLKFELCCQNLCVISLVREPCSRFHDKAMTSRLRNIFVHHVSEFPSCR